MDELLHFSLHRLEIRYAVNAPVTLMDAQATLPVKVPAPSISLTASAQLAIKMNAFYSSELEKETVLIHDVSYLRRRRLFIEPDGVIRIVDNYLSSVWSIEAEHRNK